MLINWLNEKEGIFGDNTGYLISEFIEKEKICPKLVIEIVEDMALEHFRLDDGRVMMPYKPKTDISLSERFSDELRAHHTFHTGGIRCPKV